LANVVCVSAYGSREFRVPIIDVRPWQLTVDAILMAVAVPKAAVNEDNFSLRAEHQVGFARQILAVKSKPKS
jgi:hypothetical protein